MSETISLEVQECRTKPRDLSDTTIANWQKEILESGNSLSFKGDLIPDELADESRAMAFSYRDVCDTVKKSIALLEGTPESDDFDLHFIELINVLITSNHGQPIILKMTPDQLEHALTESRLNFVNNQTEYGEKWMDPLEESFSLLNQSNSSHQQRTRASVRLQLLEPAQAEQSVAA